MGWKDGDKFIAEFVDCAFWEMIESRMPLLSSVAGVSAEHKATSPTTRVPGDEVRNLMDVLIFWDWDDGHHAMFRYPNLTLEHLDRAEKLFHSGMKLWWEPVMMRLHLEGWKFTRGASLVKRLLVGGNLLMSAGVPLNESLSTFGITCDYHIIRSRSHVGLDVLTNFWVFSRSLGNYISRITVSIFGVELMSTRSTSLFW
jgi:hypothetical protein